jgi:endonuclease/exonuclease/phosphatase family metal-dependent hydrolase
MEHRERRNDSRMRRFLINVVLWWSCSISSIAFLVALALLGVASSDVVVSFHIVPIKSPRIHRRFRPNCFVVDRHNHGPTFQSTRIWSTTVSTLADNIAVSNTIPTYLTAKSSASVAIVPPHGSFRNTLASSEVSVVSYNALAPSYHILGRVSKSHDSSSSSRRLVLLDEEEEAQQRNALAQQDRKARVPLSINSAKLKNADILCLQEVEGGPIHEPILAELLATDVVVDNQGKALNDDDDDDPTAATTTTTTATIEGYDSYVWSPLHPKRQHIDVVGLCVAWRSTRYRLVLPGACESFPRGMVVQLANVETGAIVTVGNVHLPAKPSAIEGRLRSISKTIRTIQEVSTSSSSKSSTTTRSSGQEKPLDGMVIIVGDMNCEHNAPSSKLMTKGYTLYGTLHDRNYKVKITKLVASQMKHSCRFRNVYRDSNINEKRDDDNNDDCRRRRAAAANVTVSLSGRGPGCMDMMYFAPCVRQTTRAQQQLQSQHPLYRVEAKGRRSRRREKKKEPSSSSFQSIRVQSVLATMDQNEETGDTAATRKNEVILNGLPNESEGFYSDHLPIGALFTSINNTGHTDADDGSSLSKLALPGEHGKNNAIMKKRQEPIPEERHDSSSSSDDTESHHGRDSAYQVVAGPARRRRRETYAQSVRVRQRHNAVLRTLAEWLIDRGATDVLRDQPLYKWKWVDDSKSQGRLRKKIRAPDLCCVLPHTRTLVIVEVTIVGSEKLDEARQEKLSKYRDVVQFLDKRSNSAPGIAIAEERNDAQIQQQTARRPWARVENIVVVLDVFGNIPQTSWKDLDRLAVLSSTATADGQVDRNDNHDDRMAESRRIGNELSCILQDENDSSWNSNMLEA